MEQVKPFNISKGGTTPNMCLANVTKGYGIPNKYGSAWQAWEHTQQHTDRNVPAGVDVPIYYSYTATIDGVTENYGHINVRLANGTVWSDGNIYASIDAYLANHLPKYVGWGESVNDVTVIKQGDDEMSQAVVDDIYAKLDQINKDIKKVSDGLDTLYKTVDQQQKNTAGLSTNVENINQTLKKMEQ